MNTLRHPRVLACLLALALPGCTGAEAAGGRSDSPGTPPPAEASRPAEQYVVILDRSGSMTPQELNAMEVHTASVLRGVSFGDRVALMRVPSDGIRTSGRPELMDMPPPMYAAAPDADDSLALEATRRMLVPRLRRLVSMPPTRGTDLFAALHKAGELAQQSGGRRTTVVLISDMLQCAAGVCMEPHGQVPDAAWITAQKQSGLVPTLAGSCIVVIGADASTAHGVRVRRFWSEYFRAAGTRLDEHRYVHDITDPALLRCSTR